MAVASRFEGKTMIVTGAGSGIGLVSEGGTALGLDTNESGLKESVGLAQAAANHGGRTASVVASVADEGAVKRAVAEFVKAEGRLDVLVNMAGILRSTHTTETTLEQFLSVIQVNLVGTFLFCREALPHLVQTRGNIVNAASTAASFGHPYMAAYAASKGAIAALTHALAWEYMQQGVRVNAVAPGNVGTPMGLGTTWQFPPNVDMRLFAHLTRLDGQFGQAEDVAGVIAMLASADGAFINGAIIRIDGGTHS
jgi:NAD(P)-dependent dehydrogenase (short-subunit alcohol dehydrogenase family)